jgi:hypothetical protein
MDIIQNYRNVKTLLSLALTEEGKELFKGYEWIYSELSYLSTIVDGIYQKYMLENIPELEDKRYELSSYQKLKGLLDEQDTELLKTTDAQITELLREVANYTQYDPELYFETYFNQVGNSSKVAVNSEMNDVKSISFHQWFNGSKVVDMKGDPLLVYHGRYNAEVTTFKFDLFPAKYFAENKSYAEWFANSKGEENATLYKCHLRILNPLDLSVFGINPVRYKDLMDYIELRYDYKLPPNKVLEAMSRSAEQEGEDGMWVWRYFRNGVDWLRHLNQEGIFDGIHFVENNPSEILPDGKENTTPVWMVFRPEQIKSANGNILNNINSKDIRFEKGGKL